MTICIATSCDGGKAIVVASDRMLSAPFLTVEFDHQDAKIDQIGNNCVALSAGDALCVQDVLMGGIGAASQLQNPSIKTLADQVKHQFCDIRKQRINDFVFGPRGIDFDGFYQGGMISRFPQDLSMLTTVRFSGTSWGLRSSLLAWTTRADTFIALATPDQWLVSIALATMLLVSGTFTPY